jgi:hypothetical protein
VLGVQDREFEKVWLILLFWIFSFQFKFTLIANNRIIRDYDQTENVAVNLNEFRPSNPSKSYSIYIIYITF